MPEVLFPILYHMNKHKSHSYSHGFSTSWRCELCFKLNACHRCCQISWINAVAQIITWWSEMKLILYDSQCSVVCGCCCVHISGWRGDEFSQAHRIKGEVGRTGLSVWTLPEGRLQGLDQTEKTSENLYYGLVPSSAGLLSGEKVKQRFKVRDLKVKMKTAWWTKVMNDKSKVKPEKTWFG